MRSENSGMKFCSLQNCYLILIFGFALFPPISVVQLVCCFIFDQYYYYKFAFYGGVHLVILFINKQKKANKYWQGMWDLRASWENLTQARL